METKKNKKLFNIIMVVIIALIIIGGAMAVGSVKGWFGSSESSIAVAEEISGVVSVERKGVSFNLDKGAELEIDDTITTNEKAEAIIVSEDNYVMMNESSEITLKDFTDEKLSISLDSGEIFVIINNADGFGKIFAQDNEITSGKAVFSVNVQTGSMGINVFSGEVTISDGEETLTAKAGEAISVVGDEFFLNQLQAISLNEFNIDQAKKAGKDNEICFTEEELDKVLEDRQNEVEEAEKEAESGETASVNSGTSGSSSASGSSSSSSSGSSQGSSSGASGGSSSQGSANVPSGGSSASGPSCTIEIRCDTILNNMANLTSGKEGYVPSNGTILKTTTVTFTEGETVFDVLNRVCKNRGIQIEYSWTPMYGSYYVEGINNLYEFDCGQQSGWMYKVNGWFPNYGCSSYTLKDGDTIVWCYTCNGLGADVGASMY